MLLLKKTAVLCLSLLFLCVLLASYSSAYGAAPSIPGLGRPHKDGTLPKATSDKNIVALIETEDSVLASVNSLPPNRVSETQTENPGGAEVISANRTVSFPEFSQRNCDLVLNL